MTPEYILLGITAFVVLSVWEHYTDKTTETIRHLTMALWLEALAQWNDKITNSAPLDGTIDNPTIKEKPNAHRSVTPVRPRNGAVIRPSGNRTVPG